MVITNFDFLFLKSNIFLFVSDFQLISKINLSSMIVLMKCDCNNARWYQFWLDVSISWKKAQITINLGKMTCHFTTNINAFCALNIDVIKTKFGPKLQYSLLYQLILHIVDTSIIWVARSWRIIRTYPYSQNSEIPEVVTFYKYIKKTQKNSNLALSNGTHFGTIFIYFNSDFSMSYLSFLIYPYAFHSVPHSPIQRSMGIQWWVP